MPKKKILIIINPLSGRQKKDGLSILFEKYLNPDIFDKKIVFTQYPGHATQLAADAVKNKTDIVAVAGGDGSVNETAKVLVNTNIALGVIPRGSGNGLANHLKIPSSIKKSVEMISRMKTDKIDSYTINGKYGFNLSGVGFDARIAYLFNKNDQRGFWSYLRITLKEYFRYYPKQYTIKTSDGIYRTRLLLVSFANSNQFGNHARIAPGASVKDGKIDIVMLKKVSPIIAPFMGTALLSGTINFFPFVRYLRCSECKVEIAPDDFLHIDGDPAECPRELHIKVNPLSLRVIVP
ncbi:MAG: diacylglycerol/lipid kinase family protein [Bacteroidota bacterium]